jgi:hypothetical protein
MGNHTNNRFKAYISNDPEKGKGTFWDGSTDPLREKLKAYWTCFDPSIAPKMAYRAIGAGGDSPDADPEPSLHEIFNLARMVKSNTTNPGTLVETGDDTFYRHTQTFSVQLETGGNDPPTWDLAAFLDDLNNQTFTDCTTFGSVPLTSPDWEKYNLRSLDLFKTDFVYNRLHQNFEKNLLQLAPGSIPNLYGYYIAEAIDAWGEGDPYGRCEDPAYTYPFAYCKYASQDMVNFMLTDNFGQFSLDIDTDKMNEFAGWYKNIIFPPGDSTLRADAKTFLDRFPMYIKFEWPSYEASEFVYALRDAQLYDDFVYSAVNYFKAPGEEVTLHYVTDLANPNVGAVRSQTEQALINYGGDLWSQSQYEIIEALEVTTETPGMPQAAEVTLKRSQMSASVGNMDVLNWWELISTTPDAIGTKQTGFHETGGSLTALSPRDRITMDLNTLTNIMATTGYTSSALNNLLKTLIFYGKLKQIVKDNFISWEDLVVGKTCHSEIIFYRVTRTRGEFTTPEQTYWIAESPSLNITEYIDTQVWYDQKYTYNISAFKLVIGASYTYSSFETVLGTPEYVEKDVEKVPELSDDVLTLADQWAQFGEPKDLEGQILGESLDVVDDRDDAYAFEEAPEKYETKPAHNYKRELTIKTTPTFKLIECEFGKFSGTIIDSPPIPPNIDIIPYKGVNNKLLFNFNTSTGEYMADPIIIMDSEADLIDKIRETQNLPSDAPILYKTDDHAKAFEVFRMTTPPTSYQDFKNAFLTSVSTDIATYHGDLITTSATSYVDLVTSNTVYYYIFRTVDYHGYTSNPSPVYKVELVEEDGAIYPLIEIMENFEEIVTHQVAKQFKKLFSIVPRYTQAQVDIEGSFLGSTGGMKPQSIVGLNQNVQLGLDNDKLFGQKFKIRLISKHTGRKIDFNIAFEHTKGQS